MRTAGRREWLSITPEPERELPRAIAILKAGGAAAPGEIEAERRRAEELVMRGSRRRWTRWLADVRALAHEAAPRDERQAEEVGAAREVLVAVIDNHDALVQGLPGPEPPALGERGKE